ncbi:MAG: glycerol-3-phosphate acyltransferase [Candidatus Aminicenantes bacterium]|nr:glycerol-3-phosphate acyltransferase [Candidatus Aminicenantes bacterium]
MKYFVFLILGYFLGSLSPAYFLGKILKGIDIRKFGDGNAGTINVYKILGLWPAVVTAVFDLSKGLLAMYLCWRGGGSALIIHLTGLAAILGHIFPFYLGFRGGQGVATATAIMIYYLTIFYLKAWLPLNSLPFLALAVIVFSWIARKGEFVGLVILPLLGLLTAVFLPRVQYLTFILSLIIYILFINILNLSQQKAFDWSAFPEKDIIGWRVYLRPLAFLLVIFYIFTDRNKALTAIGAVALFFLLLDLTRLISARVNIFFFRKIKGIYKSKEHRKFSSITIFLLSLFLTILIFEKKIAIFSASFLTFGDFFSKFFGLRFGRHKLFSKTLEGSLAHFTACLLAGFILNHYFPLPFYVYLAGAAAATIFELLPLGIDDNFSISLLSASVMTLYKVF